MQSTGVGVKDGHEAVGVGCVTKVSIRDGKARRNADARRGEAIDDVEGNAGFQCSRIKGLDSIAAAIGGEHETRPVELANSQIGRWISGAGQQCPVTAEAGQATGRAGGVDVPIKGRALASRIGQREIADSLDAEAVVAGIMEHIEHAGVHSGDSTCVIPPFALPRKTVERIRTIARALAKELRVCGLMNVQMAVKDDEIYIIEVNPRASRTVPFVGKAKGEAWAAAAPTAMRGDSPADHGVTTRPHTRPDRVQRRLLPATRAPAGQWLLSAA